jgi:hypothetical protein
MIFPAMHLVQTPFERISGGIVSQPHLWHNHHVMRAVVIPFGEPGWAEFLYNDILQRGFRGFMVRSCGLTFTVLPSQSC